MDTDNGRFARLDERTGHILARLDELVPLINDFERRLRVVEQEIHAVRERQTIIQTLQATFTTVMSTVAAIVGTRQ